MANLTNIPAGSISSKNSFGFTFFIVLLIIGGFYLLMKSTKKKTEQIQSEIIDEDTEIE